MSDKYSLSKYRKKRNFTKTTEPKAERTKKKMTHVFVIQEHDASSLHYDFRLEIDGVLVSWAVPKGITTDPRKKRLAIMTEDHPIEYADFEGIIPEGEYGAGPVLIWDRGNYRNLKKEKVTSMRKALEDGHITVWLEGKKIRGGYALTKVEYRGKNDWLLVKMKDEEADARRNPVSTQPESVKSGKTIKELADDSNGND